MGLYENNNGTLTTVAGQVSPEIGASTVRTGTFTAALTANATTDVNVVFSVPMPDDNYLVELSQADASSTSSQMWFNIGQKTANGFKVRVTNVYNGAYTPTFKYTAFRLYTDNKYNELVQTIDNGNSHIPVNPESTTGLNIWIVDND